MSERQVIPYVVGQWVYGEKFYGREELLRDLLEGPRRWSWVAGLRRIGKTSLLKQLEFLSNRAERSYLPIFWDFQGVDRVEELHLSLLDALLDAEEPLAALGIATESVEGQDFQGTLQALSVALGAQGAELLLLCDEVDDLAALERCQPGLADSLWSALAGFPKARVVIASSVRLGELSKQHASMEQMVEPFGECLLLGTLMKEESRALLFQENLAKANRPHLPKEAVAELESVCGGHPMLLQLAGKRCLELGNALEALEQMGRDRAVQHLFKVDFELLSPQQQSFLTGVVAAPSRGPGELTSPLAGDLLALGLLQQDGATGFAIPNRFLERWLLEAGK